MDLAARTELVEEWRARRRDVEHQRERADLLAVECKRERERSARLALQTRLASQSRWLRLGRKLGLGPKFE
jgi:hypothetical protein